MKSLIGQIIILLAVATTAMPQSPKHDHAITVTYEINGKPTHCDNLRIQLRVGTQIIIPEMTAHGFIVPPVIEKLNVNETTNNIGNIDISITCGIDTFDFPGHYPGWIQPGYWHFGAAYPPTWYGQNAGAVAPESGAWEGYLLAECYDCDPGVIEIITHPNPPPSLVNQYRMEQPYAHGKRARDLAYALAIFNVDYKKNRDYLVTVLNSCISKPDDYFKDGRCDNSLLKHLTNLYWRGDNTLLNTLLQSADSKNKVVRDIDDFYGKLLEGQTSGAMSGIRLLSGDKQKIVCERAGEDGFYYDPQKVTTVTGRLRAMGDNASLQCAYALEKGAKITE